MHVHVVAERSNGVAERYMYVQTIKQSLCKAADSDEGLLGVLLARGPIVREAIQPLQNIVWEQH